MYVFEKLIYAIAEFLLCKPVMVVSVFTRFGRPLLKGLIKTYVLGPIPDGFVAKYTAYPKHQL